MQIFQFYHHKTAIFAGLIALLLLVGVACGSAAPEPTETPSAPPSQPAAQEQPAAPASPKEAPAAKAEPTEAPAKQPGVVIPTATPLPQKVADVPKAAESVKAEGILRIANKDLGPAQFLPKNMAVPQATYVSAVVFNTLWKLSPDGELQNDLLESWSQSADGRTWTLKFKKDIPFHKGWGTVTVQDFLWVVGQIQEEDGRHPGKTQMKRLYGQEGQSVNIIDDLTVEVNTGDLVAYDFIWRHRQRGATNPPPIASKAYAEDVGEEKATLEGIGTGPWQFVEFRTNERFISEAVEDHWNKTPYFKELHYFQIAEESTRLANFLAGELDTMQTAIASVPAMLEAPDVKFMRFAGALELHITLHGQLYIPREGIPERDLSLPWNAATADTESADWERARKVREAMRISIDRESIVDNVLDGEATATNPYWRWSGYEHFFDDEMRNTKPEYNPERAKQLLKEVGLEDGFSVDMALTQRSYPGTPLIGEAICVQWEEVNIRCNQQKMPMTAFRPHFVNRTWKGFNTHDNGPSDEPLNAYNQGVSTKGLIMRGMEHPFLEEMRDKGLNEPDFQKRIEIQRDIAKWILHNAVHFPVASINVVWPVGPEIDVWNMGCCARDIASNLEWVPHRGQFDGKAFP
ncbi:MAG: ABC transporter substrate-binding protein [Dehalococcoidia bacterium]